MPAESTLPRRVRRLLSLAAAVVYALLAIVAVVALDAQRRARELAYLRTLGLSERQAFTLTVVEHAPPVLLALAIGVGLGLGLAWLLEPGLVGSRPLRVDVELGDGLTRGRTVADPEGLAGRPPNAEVGVAIDRERLIDVIVEAVGMAP